MQKYISASNYSWFKLVSFSYTSNYELLYNWTNYQDISGHNSEEVKLGVSVLGSV